MAREPLDEHGFRILIDGFTSALEEEADDSVDEAKAKDMKLRWFCAPDGWQVDENDDRQREGRGGSWKLNNKTGQLIVKAPAKKDFWRKTYYQPILVKDNGPFLFATVPEDQVVTMTTSFSIRGTTSQFDQAGLMVRLDSNHWLKTGIEIVDGRPRLSCVCCNVYSDWSTQSYNNDNNDEIVDMCQIRLHVLPGRGVVVEAWDNATSDWQFIRICHLSRNMQMVPDPLENHEAVTNAWCGDTSDGTTVPKNHVCLGVFAACPEDQTGCTVTFHDLSIVAGSTFKHDADGVFLM